MKHNLFKMISITRLAPWVALSILLIQSPAMASEKSVYVKSEQTYLREKATAIGKKLKDVKRGHALSVIEEKSGWLFVKGPDGTQGWINALSTQSEPIARMAGVSAGGDAVQDEFQSARQRMRPRSAVMGVRGLRENEKDPENSKYPADYKKLKEVEKYEVPAQKAKEYQKSIHRE